MNQRRTILLAIGVLCFPSVLPSNAQETNPAAPVSETPRQTAEVFDAEDDIRYLLYLPKDYKTPSESDAVKWPLMVFLHGAGERGSDIRQVAKHGPPKRVASDPDFPFVLISPQCPKGSRWDPKQLLPLIDATIKQHNIDPDRVYLTGLSMGGFGSWALSAEAPDKFAAVAPICGGGDPETADALKDIPFWVFHGDADRVVPISASQKMVDAVKAAGGNSIKFTIYEGVGHDSWSASYANDELYAWFLAQNRSDRGSN